jgi:hypothetical protein
MSEFETTVVEFARTRLTRVFPEQIRRCLGQLTDEQIWWRPNEESNSIGNIVLHLTGSLNHFLNHKLGGMDYTRDRPAEFAERRLISRGELLRAFDEMVVNAEKTLGGLTVERLSGESTTPDIYRLAIEDLLGVVTHISNHAGQIVWITKMFASGAVNELWMKSHKHGGAWRAKVE